MEVKPGYKQTEVGVIPEEWETQTVLGLSRQIIDYRGRTPRKLGMEWGQGDIPALSAGNVKMGFIDFSQECYFGSEALYKRWMTQGEVKQDDIIFTTEAPLGNVALIPDERKYILSQRTVLLQIDPEQASSRFLFQFMLSSQFQKVLADYSSGSTAKGIQRKKFEKLLLAKPPLPEQRAIATALSDVDGLLGGLDRLIAKKRDLKQAAMQQLLTGQTRLPGFHGEWEVKTLGEITDSLDNLRVPLNESQRERMKGDYPYCGANGVLGFVDNYVVDDDIILMAEDGGYFDEYETRPIAYRMTGKCWVNNHAHILKAKPGFDQGFLFYSLVHKNILQFLASGTRAKLNKSEMNKIEVRRPKHHPEQTAIATVLSEMDGELAVLEQRREKTRALKQAMMQELLTGKTRLV
jgi:type I restriction enzyme S subunit